MTALIGHQTPIKDGMGKWLKGFHQQFLPDTKAAAEWAARDPRTAMVWVPGRMVDHVEDMLSSWRRNANSGGASSSAFIPVVFIGLAPEYVESPSEAGRQVVHRMPVTIPADTLNRSFRARVISADIRSQIVVVTSEPMTAASIVGQLAAWATATPSFTASFEFAGFATEWPVLILSAERMAVDEPLGEHLTVRTVDLTIRASIPLLEAPKPGDATDGQGTPGDDADPPGFPVVSGVVATQHPLAASDNPREPVVVLGPLR